MTAILVSYNTRELTLAALDSLATATSGFDMQVIVVDNDSADGSAAAIREHAAHVELVENRDNVGFARAVNQGLEVADGDYVMLLNPDCELAPDTVHKLIGYLDEHPDVGVVAPMITHPEGRLRVLSAGFFPSARRLAAHYSGLTRLQLRGHAVRGLNLRIGADAAAPLDVEWVSGACLLASRELFTELDGLSERWFMYAEDMDFCARALERGHRVVHLPDARATHHVGASSDSAVTRRAQGTSTVWIDNLEDFYVLHYRPHRPALYAWRAIFAGGLLSRAVAYRLLAATRPAQAALWRQQADNYAAFARRAIRRRSAA